MHIRVGYSSQYTVHLLILTYSMTHALKLFPVIPTAIAPTMKTTRRYSHPYIYVYTWMMCRYRELYIEPAWILPRMYSYKFIFFIMSYHSLVCIEQPYSTVHTIL